jgi:hypothetical protein
LFVQYLGYDQKTAVSVFGWVIGVGFALIAAVMWREVSITALVLLALYFAYVVLEKIIDTSPVAFAIVFSAAWIVWAIKTKR